MNSNPLPAQLTAGAAPLPGPGAERSSARRLRSVGVFSLLLTLAFTAPALAQLVNPDDAGTGSTASADIQRARDLIRSATPQAADAAYALLLPLESAQPGDPEFDYLLGLAALESGKSNEAVFALQRAVVADPDFSGARLELARAYFAAGDNEEARREFNALAAQPAPSEAAALIQSYLEAIERRSLRYRAGWQSLAEFGAGYDSNANGGTADSSFLGFALNEASREADSGFYGVQGQLGYTSPLTPALAWRAAVDARHREYPDAQFVSQTSGRVRAGLLWAGADWQLASDISAEALALDGRDNRRIVALDLAGHRPLTSNTTALASLRVAQLRYDQALEVQDVDQWLGALNLQWRPPTARRWQLLAGPVAGREDAQLEGSPFGRDLIGARAEVSAVSRSWVWRASLGSLHSDYDGRFFGQSRTDRQLSLQLQLEVPGLLRAWSLRPTLAYIDNQSDLALYEYERIEAGLSLQRRW